VVVLPTPPLAIAMAIFRTDAISLSSILEFFYSYITEFFCEMQVKNSTTPHFVEHAIIEKNARIQCGESTIRSGSGFD
jgi:hypothetical protein